MKLAEIKVTGNPPVEKASGPWGGARASGLAPALAKLRRVVVACTRFWRRESLTVAIIKIQDRFTRTKHF
jgi:hypothetical protein